ncbi:30S ribosomal protein S16 [Balneola sp. MJW-20]|uniref:30S ribosomal protein S16 n=1 Tax=Gracilimonas aurantiaca TaxID=3234185 RepID=UPI003466DCAE
MLRIRLQRKGRKKRPVYHIVVADSRSPRDGRIIEQIGRYDNVTEKKEVVLNEERIFYWLDSGAQPSDTVRKILRREGLLYKRHLMMWGKSEEEIEEALSEWRSYRESKDDSEVSRKEQQKEILAAEEKEYKKQLQEKAAKAAAEVEAEAAAEEAEEEAAAEAVEESAEEEAPAEETAEAEEMEAVAEEEVADEPEAVEESAEEAETETAEEAEEEAPSEEETEAAAEEEETTEEEAPAEEEKAEAPGQVSTDMTAKEAIDHINNTDLADLKGFVPEDEDRVTVQRAWESKQEG